MPEREIGSLRGESRCQRGQEDRLCVDAYTWSCRKESAEGMCCQAFGAVRYIERSRCGKPCSVPLRVCAQVPVPCVCVTGLGSLREEAENWRVSQIRECYENSEESTESCTRKRDRIEPTRKQRSRSAIKEFRRGCTCFSKLVCCRRRSERCNGLLTVSLCVFY